MKAWESVTHNSGRILWKAADNQCLQALLFYIISSSVQLSWAGARKLIFSVKVGLLSVRFKMKLRRWGFKVSLRKGKHTFSSAMA
jgi:hypothetical protein